MSDCVVSSAIGTDFPPLGWGEPRAMVTVCNVWGLLDSSDQQLRRGLLIPGVGGFVRWSMNPGESIEMGKFHLNSLCIFIHRIVHIVSILGRQPIAGLLLFQTSLLLFYYLSVLIYLPLPTVPLPPLGHM